MLPIPQRPILKLTIDFITGLPLAKTRTGEVIDAILVIVDRYTKFLGYFVIIIMIITVKLADLFLEWWFLFNILRGIMSNKGTIFNNIF